jgi:hypothetical protein
VRRQARVQPGRVTQRHRRRRRRRRADTSQLHRRVDVHGCRERRPAAGRADPEDGHVGGGDAGGGRDAGGVAGAERLEGGRGEGQGGGELQRQHGGGGNHRGCRLTRRLQLGGGGSAAVWDRAYGLDPHEVPRRGRPSGGGSGRRDVQGGRRGARVPICASKFTMLWGLPMPPVPIVLQMPMPPVSTTGFTPRCGARAPICAGLEFLRRPHSLPPSLRISFFFSFLFSPNPALSQRGIASCSLISRLTCRLSFSREESPLSPHNRTVCIQGRASEADSARPHFLVSMLPRFCGGLSYLAPQTLSVTFNASTPALHRMSGWPH